MCWYPTTTESFLNTAKHDEMKVTDHGNGLYEATETTGWRSGDSVFYLQGAGISDYVTPGTCDYNAVLAHYTELATQQTEEAEVEDTGAVILVRVAE